MLALDEFISGLDRPLMFFVPVIGSASSVVASGSLLQTLAGSIESIVITVNVTV